MASILARARRPRGERLRIVTPVRWKDDGCCAAFGPHPPASDRPDAPSGRALGRLLRRALRAQHARALRAGLPARRRHASSTCSGCEHGLEAGIWPGIDTAWVYPIVALVPMIVAYLFGPDFYVPTWLTFVMIVDAAAFAVITAFGRDPRVARVGWWWLALPAAARTRRPRADRLDHGADRDRRDAGARHHAAARGRAADGRDLDQGVAGRADRRDRRRGARALDDRPHRRRSPPPSSASSPCCSARAPTCSASSPSRPGAGCRSSRRSARSGCGTRSSAGSSRSFVYYDQAILTYQVVGPGLRSTAANLTTPLLAIVTAALLVLGFVAIRRGVDAGPPAPAARPRDHDGAHPVQQGRARRSS